MGNPIKTLTQGSLVTQTTMCTLSRSCSSATCRTAKQSCVASVWELRDHQVKDTAYCAPSIKTVKKKPLAKIFQAKAK